VEKGQYVSVCLPVVGPGGTRQIMYGVIKEWGGGGRVVVTCKDGKDRFFHPAVLRPLSPLEILAEQFED
jgi:hypothetical protein